jgi:class 3 adenylate cyclase
MENSGQEQRVLASVMFTDVVGFSKLSAINEERTYAALKRDFDLLYTHISAHGGQVLNTMGDGMMVVFMSAVDAVRCARAIQENLHQLSLTKPEHGILQHRIGLHLGEVFLNGRNTMGDTVNQAARIQSLARPDSIAMSRDFYEVIKNKVTIPTKYLGPRMAKNIPEPIPIHEVSPIDDALRQQAADILFTPPPTEATREVSGRKGIALLIISIILLAGAATPIFLLGSVRKAASDQAKKEGKEIKPGSIKNDKKSLDKIRGALNKGDKQDANAPANDTSETNAPATSVPATFALTPEQLGQISGMLTTHDYAGIVTVVKAIPGADSAEGQAMIAKYDQLVKFKEWLQKEADAATDMNPISATIEGTPAKVYASATGLVIQANEQTSTPKMLWEWKNATIAAIADACLASPPTRNPAPNEAATWIATFRELQRA